MRAFADLARLTATAESTQLLSALVDVTLLDAAGEHFTPFEADALHRFRLKGKMRGRSPAVRIDTPVWTDAGRITVSLTQGQVDRALAALAPELAPDRLKRMAMQARGWTVRGTGVAGVVEVEAVVELALGPLRWRAPAIYKVSDAGATRPVTLRPPDLMRIAALARSAPFFALLEPHARRFTDEDTPEGALAVSVQGDRATVPLTWDVELPGGNHVAMGGTLVVELANGRAAPAEATFAVADLPRCGVPELAGLALRPDVQWLAQHAGPASFVHVVGRPAGWLVAIETGAGDRLDLAVGGGVRVLTSLLPAAAQADPDVRLDAQLRGFLAEASAVSSGAAIAPLARAYPGVLLTEVFAAQEALARKDRAAAAPHLAAARLTADELRATWAEARDLAARGGLTAAAAKCLAALKLCPTDTRLWTARRRLVLATTDDVPGPLAPELPAWRRAPYDAPRLLERLAALEAGASPAVRTTAPPEELLPPLDAAVKQNLPGWQVAGLGHEAPSSPAAESRLTVKLTPATRDPALPAVQSIVLFPPVASAPTTAQIAETMARLAALRIGTTYLLPRSPPPQPDTSIWVEQLDPEALFPALDARTLKPVPDGLLENLGPLRREVLSAAYRGPLALVSFSTGKLVGVDIAALDRTLLTQLELPGAAVTGQALRELLTPVFDPVALPWLSQAELRLAKGSLEIAYLPQGGEDLAIAKALRKATPFLAMDPGRLRLERTALWAIGGVLRASPPR